MFPLESCRDLSTKLLRGKCDTVDRYYLEQVIENLEHERKVHDQKFARNVAHKDCLPRFDRTLEKLREELLKLGPLKE